MLIEAVFYRVTSQFAKVANGETYNMDAKPPSKPANDLAIQFDAGPFRRELIELIPHLRAFARSLCGNATLADDIVQDTLFKAWTARERFEPGTNMKAWSFTILRNHFYTLKRRSWRQYSLDPEVAEQTIVSVDTPLAAIELNELRHAMSQLPDKQREAIILVGAGGFSYEEASDICGVAIGTIKSRVCRARAALIEILDSKDFCGSQDQDNVRALGAMGSLKREIDDILHASDTAGDKISNFISERSKAASSRTASQ